MLCIVEGSPAGFLEGLVVIDDNDKRWIDFFIGKQRFQDLKDPGKTTLSFTAEQAVGDVEGRMHTGKTASLQERHVEPVHLVCTVQ